MKEGKEKLKTCKKLHYAVLLAVTISTLIACAKTSDNVSGTQNDNLVENLDKITVPVLEETLFPDKDISADNAETLALIDMGITNISYLTVESTETKIDGEDGYEVIIDAIDAVHTYKIRRSDAAIISHETAPKSDQGIVENLIPIEDETTETQSEINENDNYGE